MRRSPALLLVLITLLPAAALAQVGYPPAHSPYRDIPPGHTLTATMAHFGGGGGDFGIGPHHGTLYGGRYEIPVGALLNLGVGAAHGTLDRLIVNPFVAVADRVSGPVDQSLTLVDADLLFRLTGRKTWHRLAPLVGVGFGIAFSSSTPADTSGYKFGNKFYISPQLGLQAFVTRRLHLRGLVRGAYWKLRYPTSFQQEPVLDPGTLQDPHAVITNGRDTEWSGSVWLEVGLGYTFSW